MSGHGLGHATRTIELLNVLGTRRRDLRLVVRTDAPAWIFELAARVPIEREPCRTGDGMVQIDSLRFDEAATVRAAAAFYDGFDAHVDREADRLRELNAALVVGDIPPIAFAAAARAGVGSLAVGNFTWDWIYASYPRFASDAPHVLPRVRGAYASAGRALRLPFHGGFSPMADRVTDLPLIARRSTRPRAATRRWLGLDGRRPVVLASFGGYGLVLPYAEALAGDRLVVLTTDRDAPGAGAPPPGGLRRLNLAELHARGVRYEDLVAAADVVLTKPGYGIVSEAMANGTALLYTTRGPFPEHDVLVAGLPRWLRARALTQADLLAGRWADAVDALLAQPDPPERPRIDGAAVAAEEILRIISS